MLDSLNLPCLINSSNKKFAKYKNKTFFSKIEAIEALQGPQTIDCHFNLSTDI